MVINSCSSLSPATPAVRTRQAEGSPPQDRFEGDPARTQGISTVVGAAIGGAAVGLATAGLTGTAAAVVGGLGGALVCGAVGGFISGAVAASFAPGGDGWERFRYFLVGAGIGGSLCAAGGAVGGAFLGTGFGNVAGIAVGAATGGAAGYMVGKGITGR